MSRAGYWYGSVFMESDNVRTCQFLLMLEFERHVTDNRGKSQELGNGVKVASYHSRFEVLFAAPKLTNDLSTSRVAVFRKNPIRFHKVAAGRLPARRHR